jgi:hypothetical protein
VSERDSHVESLEAQVLELTQDKHRRPRVVSRACQTDHSPDLGRRNLDPSFQAPDHHRQPQGNRVQTSHRSDSVVEGGTRADSLDLNTTAASSSTTVADPMMLPARSGAHANGGVSVSLDVSTSVREILNLTGSELEDLMGTLTRD